MTSRFAVIGNPIGHSLSPQLHQQFAKQLQLDIQYHKISASKAGFARVVNDFFAGGGKGLNVTAPFKWQALEYADLITQRAEDSNSVNTLAFTQEGILGDSTDGMGFLRDLQRKGCDFANKKALLLGAGGVARCIASALLLDGFEVYLLNRTVAKAQQLADELQQLGRIKLYDNSQPIDLVVNSVSKNGDKFLKQINFARQAIAYDLNYGDKASHFLNKAEQFTQQQYSGLGMLIEQGAESFSLWTGKYPDTSIIKL